MKSLVTACILFVSVIILSLTDLFMLDSFIEKTKKELEAIPKNVTELEAMNEKEKNDIKKALEKTEKMWKEKQTFLGASLKHNVSREFTGYLISAVSYYKSKEYPEFLALVSSALDTLDHISYDEGIKIGNLL